MGPLLATEPDRTGAAKHSTGIAGVPVGDDISSPPAQKELKGAPVLARPDRNGAVEPKRSATCLRWIE